MSGYLLCQSKKAKIPYYIHAISTNIYTIEELCFYFYHNIYLLDRSIINEELCDWIRDELGMRKLYVRLYQALEQGGSIGNFILPIFKEIHYLSQEEFKNVQEQIQKVEVQPDEIRRKLKGDYLNEQGMYMNAIGEYEKLLLTGKRSALGNQFYADVLSNMGAAYGNLFLFQEAADCYKEAYTYKQSVQNYDSYLYATWMLLSEKEFQEFVKREGISSEKVISLEDKITQTLEKVGDSLKYKNYQEGMEQEEAKREEILETILEECLEEYKKGSFA